jgi:hypothetical protein
VCYGTVFWIDTKPSFYDFVCFGRELDNAVSWKG